MKIVRCLLQFFIFVVAHTKFNLSIIFPVLSHKSHLVLLIFKCLLVRLKNEQYEVGFMGENRKDNRQIKFRVSDHEYEELEQTANNFHMSVPAFAKKRALGYRMKPPKVDKSGAIEIAKQLRAIGNNVNQLTKRANASNGKIDSEELQAIKKELHKIWQQFN